MQRLWTKIMSRPHGQIYRLLVQYFTIFDIGRILAHASSQGSFIFMPRNAINNRPTTHCDDLESVYYLLIFLMGSHTGMNVDKSPLARLPSDIQNWMVNDPFMVYHNKVLYMNSREFLFPLQDVFKPLEPLAVKLHLFFHDRRIYQRAGSTLTYPFTPMEDFTEFLDYFEETIERMKGNRQDSTSTNISHDDRGEYFGGPSSAVGMSKKKQNRAPEDFDRDQKKKIKM
jgi:hypothetical protein